MVLESRCVGNVHQDFRLVAVEGLVRNIEILLVLLGHVFLFQDCGVLIQTESSRGFRIGNLEVQDPVLPVVRGPDAVDDIPVRVGIELGLALLGRVPDRFLNFGLCHFRLQNGHGIIDGNRAFLVDGIRNRKFRIHGPGRRLADVEVVKAGLHLFGSLFPRGSFGVDFCVEVPVQELLRVEFRSFGHPVDFVPELADFVLDGLAVGVGIGPVGRLNRELPHTLQHGLDLV